MKPPADTIVASADHRSDPARRIVRGSTLLFAGRVISKLSNFLTQVLIVRYLPQSSFGGFAYALSVVNLVQGIITLGLDRAIVRFLPIFHEQKDVRKLFGTIVMTALVILTLGLVAIVGLYAFQGQLGKSVHDDETLALVLVLIFLAPIQALDDLLVGMFAVFARPRSIFFRRYVLAPALKLIVVAGLILSRSDVIFLAIGYIAASLLGVGIYGYLFVRLLREKGLFAPGSIRDMVMPWKEVLGFSIPLLTTDLVYVSMNAMNVLLLGYFWDPISVANFRAVQPAAKMGELVMASFATLFTPLASRMFANNDRVGINRLYWQSAIWIALFSFPVFAVTFSLAQPITVLMFGPRYEHAAPILALLSLGYYFNAALGFNGLTLRVFGKIRYTVLINIATTAVSLALGLLLVPRFGALGAGIATMVGLIVHNLLKQAGLRLGTGISLFEWRYLRVYLVIAIFALGLLGFQLTSSAPFYLSLGLAALASIFVFRLNGELLEVDRMFPELLRIPGMRFLVSGQRKRDAGEAAVTAEQGPHRATDAVESERPGDGAYPPGGSPPHDVRPARPGASSILETTLAASYKAGTNLKGQFAPAGWLHLLPSLELTNVLCIGTPGIGVLAMLARRARRVVVACVSRKDFRERQRANGATGLEGVEWLDGRDGATVSDVAQGTGLIVIAGRQGRSWLADRRNRIEIVQRILDRGGVLYLEERGLRRSAPQKNGKKWAKFLPGNLRSFRLLPLWGEPQVAVPEGDRETLDFFIERRVVHPWTWPTLPALATKLMRRFLTPPGFGHRYGLLVGGPGTRHAARPPEYLCAIACGSGVSLEEYRWGLSIPVAYRSRKLVFYLFGPRPSSPSYVVKMVSEPSLNARLENEARALRGLEALGLADGTQIPRVTFSGQHAGLTLVGESLIEGVPFRRKSDAGTSCPYAEGAVDGLIELGRTARRNGTAAGSEVAGSISRLLSLFEQTYGNGSDMAFLERRVETLRANPVPLVFQHGDVGCWNLLVTPKGQVAFLDWESAEPAGLPLWDLFYFLRSYGVLAARRHGVRSTLRAFELTFLGDSKMSHWMHGAVARYSEAVGVEKPLIEPLFYTCLVHRAVKEATRLQPGELNKGHFVNLLRLCIRERGRPILNRIFSPSE